VFARDWSPGATRPRPINIAGALLAAALLAWIIVLKRMRREELFARAVGHGFADIRPAHLAVFGSIKADGTRLTDLARWTNMGLSSMAELVDDLEAKDYVERRPDPSDGRAKLVCLTDQGWQAMRVGRKAIETIEADYARLLGRERFEAMCRALEDLLEELDPDVLAGYRTPPGERVRDDIVG
jgi:DNA-binding MarR family transcriptional regulator